MSDLILRVRALTKARTDEYDVDVESWWTDQRVQDTLDSNSTFVIDHGLAWQPQSIGGGTVEYHIAQAGYRDWEQMASGTTRWVIRDGPGAVQGTAGYTVDYRAGRITFTADQGGTAYYLTGYSYDVYGAAADIWAERLANFSAWYRFSADGQSFDRQQAWEHAQEMESLMRARAGSNVLQAASGDVRMSQFVRMDLRYEG